MISIPPSLALALAALLAYFIGGLPFGYWFVRASLGQDIRNIGSGNIGATNVHRAAGTKAGLIVLFLDIFKGFSALWVAALVTGNTAAGLALALLAVMLGHCYPIFLGFRGGKAVACYVGAILYLAPLAVLTTAFVFVAIAVFSGYISLASMLGALVFPAIYWAVYRPPHELLFATSTAALLILYRHQANIVRLRSGKESKFSWKRRAE